MMLMSDIYPGVEVLTTFEYEVSSILKSSFWLIIFIIIGIAGLHTVCDSVLEKLSPRISGLVAMFVSITLVLYICSEVGLEDKTETRYKVTISEDVKLTDFYERYEIVEQNGKIYTIRERDDKLE